LRRFNGSRRRWTASSILIGASDSASGLLLASPADPSPKRLHDPRDGPLMPADPRKPRGRMAQGTAPAARSQHRDRPRLGRRRVLVLVTLIVVLGMIGLLVTVFATKSSDSPTGTTLAADACPKPTPDPARQAEATAAVAAVDAAFVPAAHAEL